MTSPLAIRLLPIRQEKYLVTVNDSVYFRVNNHSMRISAVLFYTANKSVGSFVVGFLCRKRTALPRDGAPANTWQYYDFS